MLLGYRLQEYLLGRGAFAAPIAVSVHQVTQRSVTQVSLMGLESIPPFLLKIMHSMYIPVKRSFLETFPVSTLFPPIVCQSSIPHYL